MLGRLELVAVVQTGMFHTDMNMIIYNYEALMDERMAEPGSFTYFKLKTRWKHISDDADVIKSCGKFEDHRLAGCLFRSVWSGPSF